MIINKVYYYHLMININFMIKNKNMKQLLFK